MDTNEINRQAIEANFPEAAKRLAARHHCIFSKAPRSIRILQQTVGRPIGYWDQLFPRTVNGTMISRSAPLDWDGECPLRESFWQWGDPYNQDALPEYVGDHNTYAEFGVLLDAEISLAAIDMIREDRDQALASHAGDYHDEMLSLACDWVDTIGWCCVPCDWSEWGYAVLVVSDGYKRLVEEFRDRLTAIHEPTASLRLTNDGRVEWVGAVIPSS